MPTRSSLARSVIVAISLGTLPCTAAAQVQFGFRALKYDIHDNVVIVEPDPFKPTSFRLTGEILDLTAYSLGGFGGSLIVNDPIAGGSAMERTPLGERRPCGIVCPPIDPRLKGMPFPFRSLFQGGDGNDNAPKNGGTPPFPDGIFGLVGFDSAVAGTPPVGRFENNDDTDPRIGFGDNDIYHFDVRFLDHTPRDIIITFESLTGPDNVTQLIDDLGGGEYRYRVVEPIDSTLIIRVIPSPASALLLAAFALPAARRRCPS